MRLRWENGREAESRREHARMLWHSVLTTAVGSVLLALAGLLLPWRVTPLATGILATFVAYYLVLRAYGAAGGASLRADLGVWCTAFLIAIASVGLGSLACGIQSWPMRTLGTPVACVDCDPRHRGFVTATSTFLLLLMTFGHWADMRCRAWRGKPGCGYGGKADDGQ